MISLIINADDLGSNRDRDQGIFQAFTQGIVTSSSLLANGSSFVSAVEQANASGLPVGVHLNLADGTALTGSIKGLTNAEGLLPGKQKSRQCLASAACDLSAIRKEFMAQIERFFDNGLSPDHLDSHQHCQLFPCLTTMVTELAQKYGIPAMRTSLPAESAEQDPGGQFGEEMSLYRRLGLDAHTATINAGLKTPDGLWGMTLLNHLDTTNLSQILENLPEGCWELMTHPGYPCNCGGTFDGPHRLIELQALLSTEAKEVIARRQIRLCSFGDLACVS